MSDDLRTAGRRPRTGLELLLEQMTELIPRLDRIAWLEERRFEQSTEPNALARSTQNGILWAGMVILDANGRWSMDFAVDFASVAVADVRGNFPGLVSTDPGYTGNIAAIGQPAGAGTVQVGLNEAACLPLTGKHLQIVGNSSGGVFVAVYTEMQPFSWTLI